MPHRNRPALTVREPGSALDVSAILPNEPCGTYGRVLIRNGHFVFAARPLQPVRFYSATIEQDLQSREKIDRLVAELKKAGYNMVRTHFFDAKFAFRGQGTPRINPAFADQFDYFVSRLKANGIYLNFDLITSLLGYSAGNGAAGSDPLNNLKWRMHFLPDARRQWRQYNEWILTHRNPYTGTRLIDDPVLALTQGFNEQELFDTWDPRVVRPAWLAFLREKYRTFENYRKQHPDTPPDAVSFETLPAFNRGNLRDDDWHDFLTRRETETLCWYRGQLDEMGFTGYLSNYTCHKSNHYNRIRRACDSTSR